MAGSNTSGPRWRAAKLVSVAISSLYSEFSRISLEEAEGFLDLVLKSYDALIADYEDAAYSGILIERGRTANGVEYSRALVGRGPFRLQIEPDPEGRPFVSAIFEGPRLLASGTMVEKDLES